MSVSADVIRQAQAGDGEAFALLVHTYRRRIFGTIYRLVGRGQEVEDVGQDVFLRIHQSIGQLREVEVFDTWLYRLTVNTVYDFLRRKRRMADVPMCELSEEQLVNADAAASARVESIHTRQRNNHEHLEALLSQISDEDRLLLERKEIDGLTLKELKRIYAANESALKVRLFRARKRALEAHQRVFQNAATSSAALAA
ncbi:MAG: sigma-70 family RNA polymerase sigma factor [Bryobacterales bacterium]|nr:sigma-70 family RNA polymerase sigma factor [Acidobacteriota bacterium]MCB9383841.1 sigma-70 family RNA polymerase sigma factor [Bryobacterales bacterium]